MTAVPSGRRTSNVAILKDSLEKTIIRKQGRIIMREARLMVTGFAFILRMLVCCVVAVGVLLRRRKLLR